jgi:hypothetical protein
MPSLRRLVTSAICLAALATLSCGDPTDKPSDCARGEFFDEAREVCQRCPTVAAPRCLPGCGFTVNADPRGCPLATCSLSCDLCPPYARFSEDSLRCEDCPPGQRFDTTRLACVSCPQGQTFDRDQLACIPTASMPHDMPEDMPPPPPDMPEDMPRDMPDLDDRDISDMMAINQDMPEDMHDTSDMMDMGQGAEDMEDP